MGERGCRNVIGRSRRGARVGNGGSREEIEERNPLEGMPPWDGTSAGDDIEQEQPNPRREGNRRRRRRKESQLERASQRTGAENELRNSMRPIVDSGLLAEFKHKRRRTEEPRKIFPTFPPSRTRGHPEESTL